MLLGDAPVGSIVRFLSTGQTWEVMRQGTMGTSVCLVSATPVEFTDPKTGKTRRFKAKQRPRIVGSSVEVEIVTQGE